MKRKGTSILLALLISAGMFLIVSGNAMASGEAESAEGGSESIEWVGASAWPASSLHTKQFEVFIDLVEEKSDGRLTISVVGPETWPGPEQLNLIQDGTLDICTVTTAYYMAIMPEGVLGQFAWGNREERIEAGLHDYIDRAVNDHFNAMFIAEYPVGTLHIYLAEPVDSIDDFQGKRVRNPPLYSPGTEALGATAMMMSDADTVDGLNTGVVDGVITSSATYIDWSYHEVAPYILNPPMGHATGFVFANRESFNALPEDLQKIVLKAADESNTVADQLFKEDKENFMKIINETEVEFIQVPEEEFDEYATIYADAYLDKVVAKELGKETVEEIRSMFEALGNPPKTVDYDTIWPPSN